MLFRVAHSRGGKTLPGQRKPIRKLGCYPVPNTDWNFGCWKEAITLPSLRSTWPVARWEPGTEPDVLRAGLDKAAFLLRACWHRVTVATREKQSQLWPKPSFKLTPGACLCGSTVPRQPPSRLRPGLPRTDSTSSQHLTRPFWTLFHPCSSSPRENKEQRCCTTGGRT